MVTKVEKSAEMYYGEIKAHTQMGPKVHLQWLFMQRKLLSNGERSTTIS